MWSVKDLNSISPIIGTSFMDELKYHNYNISIYEHFKTFNDYHFLLGFDETALKKT